MAFSLRFGDSGLYCGQHTGPIARLTALRHIFIEGALMARVLTIPARPNPERVKRERKNDRKYIDGQRLLVEAMRYLAQSDPEENRDAIQLLSEHFRTKFRMSDTPLDA
jgi:hypothetical protein